MRHWLMAALLATQVTGVHAATPDQDIAVTVVRDGATLRVDSELRVAASPREVWDVLTDYDHMTRFVPTLTASAIVRRSGNDLDVTQRGAVHFGILEFPFNTTRRIALVPYTEIRTTVTDGNMKSSQFLTTLVPVGGETRIVMQGTVVPDMWIPPGLGPAILVERTRSQWQEFRAEILRRAASAATPSAPR